MTGEYTAWTTVGSVLETVACTTVPVGVIKLCGAYDPDVWCKYDWNGYWDRTVAYAGWAECTVAKNCAATSSASYPPAPSDRLMTTLIHPRRPLVLV